MLSQTISYPKFSPEYNRQFISDPAKRPTMAAKFAPYMGLSEPKARRWASDPEKYVNDLLAEALEQMAQVPAPVITAEVPTKDKVKAVCGAGSLGFSVSFMLAKAWTSLWGLLASLSTSDPRLFFIVGAAGFDLIASFTHATVANAVAFGPGANYGGPQAPDKAAFDNYSTLLGMWYVASASGDTPQANEIATALQEVVNGVITRAQAEQDKGTPLCFDFREHPLVGAWLRNQHFHWAFFSYSVVYLFSGSLAPHLRKWIEQLSATVLMKSGLFALADFLASATMGQFAGISTLSIHMLGNKYLQHGADKAGLHQTWRQEQAVAFQKCQAIAPALLELLNIPHTIEQSIQSSTLSDEEKRERQAAYRAQVLPLIEPTKERLFKLNTKYQRRVVLLESKEGRDTIAKKRAGDLVFKGGGKTPHKLINRSPHAIRIRTASVVVGNMLAMLAQAYSIFHLYMLFADTMPFTDTSVHADSGASHNGTDPWTNATSPGFVNGTRGLPGVPADTQLYSTLAGWILIAAFSLRAATIPATELLLNLFYAAMLSMGRPAGPRQSGSPSVETDDSGENPPPPTYRPQDPSSGKSVELSEVEVEIDAEDDGDAENTLWQSDRDERSPYPPSAVTVIEDLMASRSDGYSEAVTVVENSVDSRDEASDDSSTRSDAESASPSANADDQALSAAPPETQPQTPHEGTVLQDLI